MGRVLCEESGQAGGFGDLNLGMVVCYFPCGGGFFRGGRGGKTTSSAT